MKGIFEALERTEQVIDSLTETIELSKRMVNIYKDMGVNKKAIENDEHEIYLYEQMLDCAIDIKANYLALDVFPTLTNLLKLFRNLGRFVLWFLRFKMHSKIYG